MTIEAVASDVNLRRAFERVAANDGAPGVDRQSVTEVALRLDDVVDGLHQTLLDGSYQPGLVRRVWIPKGGGGQRGLGIPNVVDRVVQQAVHQVLSPHFEKTFHDGSHGFRPGRSCHTAIAQARECLLNGAEYVVDLDLEKFFDRVNHDRLMARLAARIDDKRVLKLIRRMLTAGVVMPNGVIVTTEEGTPQGGPLSPLLSNIVLDELDWELERRGLSFVRYADDGAPRRRGEEADDGYLKQLSCTRDEGRSLGFGMQVQDPNHLKLRRHNGRGGERSGKRRGEPRQVRAGKANVSEPLTTCRKRRDVIETRLLSLVWDEARGVPAECPSDDRHGDGASPAQALVWNVGTFSLDVKGDSPSGGPTRSRVPKRGEGTDGPVVVMKPSNAGGAKGSGDLADGNGQPAMGGAGA